MRLTPIEYKSVKIDAISDPIDAPKLRSLRYNTSSMPSRHSLLRSASAIKLSSLQNGWAAEEGPNS